MNFRRHFIRDSGALLGSVFLSSCGSFPSNKKDYVDADAANAEMVNTNGKNGGWTGAQVLSE